jgi:hypothetical protein
MQHPDVVAEPLHPSAIEPLQSVACIMRGTTVLPYRLTFLLIKVNLRVEYKLTVAGFAGSATSAIFHAPGSIL